MNLQEFLDRFQIDTTALARIRRRLFVVGRFNQRARGKDPEVYLFTSRSNLSDKYVKNFTGVADMRYESFVKALNPAIAERVDIDGRFPTVRQIVPQGDEAEDSGSVIDTFNYFFLRAVANSDQPAFDQEQPGLPKELLRDSESERGKGILKLIRQNLNIFCTFQTRTHEIVEAMGRLLGECGREHDMPAFAAGRGLPGGFPEKLIDFVNAEDTRTPFSLDGLDLSEPPWDALAKNEAAGATFCRVVNAFRNALINSKIDQDHDLRFRGKTLGKQARAVLPEDLVKQFCKARDAFNGLHQILRSKVLLSMILEWLLSSYYQVADVKELGQEASKWDKDKAVENAILERAKENGLAPKVKRPSPEERRRFSKDLAANFERMLSSILAKDGKAATEKMEGLPPEIRGLAESLRGDPERHKLLFGIAGAEHGEEYPKAFIEASKTLLLDVLCPTLYQNPVLSVQMLRKFFRQETMAAYLTAVFLGDQQQDAVRKIAEQNMDYFQSKIDATTKQIRDTGQIQERLLRNFVDVLADPEIQRRLVEGMRVLREAQGLLEKASFGQAAGAGAISAIRPEGAKDPTLDRTEVPKEKVIEPLKATVPERIEVLVAAAARGAKAQAAAASVAAAPAAPAAPAGADPEPPPAPEKGPRLSPAGKAAAAAVTAATTEEDRQEAAAPNSDMERRVDKEIELILAKSSPATTIQDLDKRQIETLTADVETGLLKDENFVGGLKKDVQAFEKALHLIYTRYVDNADKKTFRNKVERMTLVNFMLLFQRDLGLGQVCSNLHHLLLDLVQHLDPENPDPTAFLREKSLTIYFDDAHLADGGITDLRQTLEAQAHQNLENTVKFVSELRGVKYLMDVVGNDSDAEVIVVNATAPEFLAWVRKDSLTGGQREKRRLQSGMLVKSGEHAQSAIPPGLVCMTDIAFGEDGDPAKQSWLDNLSTFSMREGDLSLLLPPICLSTGVQDAEGGNEQAWIRAGRKMAEAAAKAPAPIAVLGPSLYLNTPDDAFKTYLPAGYVFGAHFLGRPEQRVRNHFVPVQSQGRFRVVGFGQADMRESLERVLWGESEGDSYAFAVDFYLYTVLTVLATALRRGGAYDRSINQQEFFPCFYDSEAVLAKGPYNSSVALNKALIGEDALRFAMDQDASKEMLQGVTLKATTRGVPPLRIKDVAWFELARKNAGLIPS